MLICIMQLLFILEMDVHKRSCSNILIGSIRLKRNEEENCSTWDDGYVWKSKNDENNNGTFIIGLSWKLNGLIYGST